MKRSLSHSSEANSACTTYALVRRRRGEQYEKRGHDCRITRNQTKQSTRSPSFVQIVGMPAAAHVHILVVLHLPSLQIHKASPEAPVAAVTRATRKGQKIPDSAMPRQHNRGEHSLSLHGVHRGQRLRPAKRCILYGKPKRCPRPDRREEYHSAAQRGRDSKLGRPFARLPSHSLVFS